MSALGIDARLAATQILHGVLFDKRLMSDLLAGEDGPIARLSGPERARAQALATGVLRHLAALDAVLDAFLDRPTPLKVRNALRLAAYEMLAEGIAAHGAVNAAVAIVRGSAKAGNLAGLTNAVGRRIAEGGAAIWEVQPPQALPSWLAKPVAKNFGRHAIGAIEVAHGRGAAFDLTLKVPSEAADWAARLEADILPSGSLRLRGRPQLTALPGFETGDWWVQDAAAALPARLLGDVAGARVLDLCAAPGGKTLQLASAGAVVTALDLSSERLERLAENLQRTSLVADVVAADVLTWTADAPFDAALLDAPCSATGTIRRHPDLPFARAGADMSGLFRVQADMIDAALAMLKPGGRLVYCTCSLLPREGEAQVNAALERHSDLTILAPDMATLGLDAAWMTAEGGVRLRPDYWADRGGMDGFYMALLQRGSP